MAQCLSISMALLAILVILLQSTLLLHNVNAYKSYELGKYCHRNPQPIVKNVKRYSIDSDDHNIGLVIPEAGGGGHYEPQPDYINTDQAKATKTLIVDGSGEDSAVQIVINNDENGYLNWQQCSMFVAARKPNGLIVTIGKLHLRPGTDWLRLSINNGSFVREFSHVNIDDERDSVAYVAHHGVLIQFESGYSVRPTSAASLQLTLTAFREADLCRVDDEYDCGSFRCIGTTFVCDGVNNCGNGRDEAGCPLDNITNYLIISTTLILVSFLIFLCLCYRCCCQRKPAYRKQYQYVKIRTSSLTPSVKRRSASVYSEADAFGRGGNLRRVRLTSYGDSMPVMIPSAPAAPGSDSTGYGSTNNTYVQLPYQPYAITFGPSSGPIGLVPARNLPSTSQPEHNTFPRTNPAYPAMPPDLFTPPDTATARPPPPYSPRNEHSK